MPNYDNTTNQPTPMQLAPMFKRHVPKALLALALTNHQKKDTRSNTFSAHQVLDVVGIENIEAAIGDDIPLHYICKRLKVTRGQFQSWIFADVDRSRRFARSLQASQYIKAAEVRSDIMNYKGNMDEATARKLRLQLQAASDLEDTLIPPEKAKENVPEMNVTFDFGSLFNGRNG